MRAFSTIAVLASALLAALAGCSDDSPPQASKSEKAVKPDVKQAADIRKIKWLEVGDRTKPETWLAYLDAGDGEPDEDTRARFRVLVTLVSQTYMENRRMVANRIAQLGKMVHGGAQPETHMQLLEGFLSIPVRSGTGGERILSDFASHYVNLRRGGQTREQALEELRRGQPAINVEALVRSAKMDPEPDDVEVSAAPDQSDPLPQASAMERVVVDVERVTSAMDAAEARDYVAIASRLGAFAMPDETPKIERLATEEIERVICRGQRCGAVAFFDDRTKTVYVDDRLDLSQNLAARSFVVHEVVHFLHLQAGKLSPDMTCEARLNLEKEAYEVQNAFLAQNGSIERIGTRLLQSMCRGAAQ